MDDERKEILAGRLQEVRGEVARLQERLNEMRNTQRRLREEMNRVQVKEYKRCALQLYLDEIRADIERLKQVDSPDARNDMKRNLEIARVRLSDLQNQF